MKIYNLSKLDVAPLEEFADFVLKELNVKTESFDLLIMAVDHTLLQGANGIFEAALCPFGKKFRIILGKNVQGMDAWAAHYVLAHELVHFEQQVTGKTGNTESYQMWCSKPYIKNDQVLKVPYKEYRQFPWEVDARKRGTKLVLKYFMKKFLKEE